MNGTLKLILISLLGILIVLVLEQYTNIDINLSDKIYNFEMHRWPISYTLHQKLNPIFYDGAKHLVATVGTFCVFYMFYALRKTRYRCRFAAALTVLLCTIIIPAAVGQIKKQTNVYCPNQLLHYEGHYPYARVLERYPDDFVPNHRGRCFPGGHVSGAFSLMSLYLFFKNKRNKILAVSASILLATVNGTYQMLRGEHFISHNLVSFFIAVILIAIINFFVQIIFSKFLCAFEHK